MTSRATLRDTAASTGRCLLGLLLPADSSLRKAFGEDVLREIAGADERANAARRLWRRGKTLPAVVLFREAFWLLVLAKLGSTGARPSRDQPSDEHIQALLRALDAEGQKPPATLEPAWKLVADPNPTAIDRLNQEEAERAAEAVNAATVFLSDLLDPGGPHRRRMRRVRLALALFACMLATGVILVLSRAPNVALRRPVSASPAAFDTNAPAAVDGVKVGPLGYHSVFEESPWLRVDLGAHHRIKEIVVYGRSDCCFNQSIPLVAEISRDGKSYELVARRTKPFSAFDPWVIDPQALSGRFVRLRTSKPAHLVVAEVEVYGRRR